MNERDFKGVWIPKNIWFTRDLTLREKCLLVEIDSLDNDMGCFAANNYLAEFLDLSPSRVSELISSLIKKGLIYQLSEKELTSYGWKTNRVLKVNKDNVLKLNVINRRPNLENRSQPSEIRTESSENRSQPLEIRITPLENQQYSNTISNPVIKPISNTVIKDESSRFLITESNEQKLEKEKETDISDENIKNDVVKNQSPRQPSDLEIVEKYFIEKYEKKYGNKPDWVFGKDRTLLKQLLVSQNIDVIMKKIDMYFENEYWFNKKSGRNFGSFRAHYNEIVEIEKDVNDMTPKEYARYGMKKLDERHKIINLGDYV